MFTPLNAYPACPVKSFLYLTGVKCDAYLTRDYPVECLSCGMRSTSLWGKAYSIRVKPIYLGIISFDADYYQSSINSKRGWSFLLLIGDILTPRRNIRPQASIKDTS